MEVDRPVGRADVIVATLPSERVVVIVVEVIESEEDEDEEVLSGGGVVVFLSGFAVVEVEVVEGLAEVTEVTEVTVRVSVVDVVSEGVTLDGGCDGGVEGSEV